MKLFIDTANVDDIREANALGVICGVTTNPSLIAKEGRDFTPIMLMAGGFTLTLGIGVIAFILGRGTNKTNEKDKYEKDT